MYVHRGITEQSTQPIKPFKQTAQEVTSQRNRSGEKQVAVMSK